MASMDFTTIATDPKDPGTKKTDGYSKQVVAEKIVNEQDQEKVNNNQGNPVAAEAADEEAKADVLQNTNNDLSEKASDEPEHATAETIEDDRKQQAGINP